MSRTALFLHGGLMDRRVFKEQIEALAPERDCVALDLPGFGAAAPLKEAMSLAGLSREVAARLDREDAAPVDLVGLSLGAGVAIELARAAPARVRSLCLVSFAAKSSLRPNFNAARRTLAAQGPRPLAAAFAARMTAAHADPHFRTLIEDMAARTPPATILALYEMLENYPPVLKDAASLTQPMLIVAGALDPSAPLADLRRFCDSAPRRDLAIMADTGHTPPLEQPARFNHILTSFWRSLDDAAP